MGKRKCEGSISPTKLYNKKADILRKMLPKHGNVTSADSGNWNSYDSCVIYAILVQMNITSMFCLISAFKIHTNSRTMRRPVLAGKMREFIF